MASATVEPKVTLATTASIPEDAWLAFFMAGYDIRSPEAIMRKGDEASGNGFWDITVEGRRLVRYGSGEYVLPHKHSEIELFAIQCGSATVWLWTNQRWNRSTVKEGDQLVIGPHVPHCLVAGDTGLIMHTVLNDSTRTIDWMPDYPIPWMS
jgi:quercetin dioxygenase-like cupin family protein